MTQEIPRLIFKVLRRKKLRVTLKMRGKRENVSYKLSFQVVECHGKTVSAFKCGRKSDTRLSRFIATDWARLWNGQSAFTGHQNSYGCSLCGYVFVFETEYGKIPARIPELMPRTEETFLESLKLRN